MLLISFIVVSLISGCGFVYDKKIDDVYSIIAVDVNEIDIYRFKHSLNSILPSDIVISAMEEVEPEFHESFDAKKKTYLYLITQTRSLFYKNYSYFLEMYRK